MDEDELVARLLSKWPACGGDVVVGPGDDCAVIQIAGESPWWQLLKTDAMVEGQHFFADEDMCRVGRKAVARVQSDFAAMGGRPVALVVTLFLPRDGDLARWERLYEGMAEAAREYGGVLCGGETSRSPEGAGLLISVAGTGRCDAPPVLRSGARVGDWLCVTGELGATLAGHHLDFVPRLAEGKWLTESGFVRAMMDVSDGLAKDLPRMCGMSGVGAEIDLSALPCRGGCDAQSAMSDGEDYELLFAVAAEDGERFLSEWAQMFPLTKMSVIGKCVEAGQGMVFHGGWDPFVG